jgi:hypothetical protein
VTLVLLGFVALGVATIFASYARTRARVRARTRNVEPAATAGQSIRHATMPTVTRAQLEHAARLQSQGASWNAIRTETGALLGANQFIRAWEREGIEHSRPMSGQHGGGPHAKQNGGEK